jgi:hypothetical protein
MLQHKRSQARTCNHIANRTITINAITRTRCHVVHVTTRHTTTPHTYLALVPLLALQATQRRRHVRAIELRVWVMQ